MVGPSSRVSRVLMTGPLAPFFDAYGLELKARGYTPLTLVNQLHEAARLSRWLEAGGLTAAELTRDRIDEFLGLQRAGGACRASLPHRLPRTPRIMPTTTTHSPHVATASAPKSA